MFVPKGAELCHHLVADGCHGMQSALHQPERSSDGQQNVCKLKRII